MLKTKQKKKKQNKQINAMKMIKKIHILYFKNYKY